jgi:hypothetical protein
MSNKQDYIARGKKPKTQAIDLPELGDGPFYVKMWTAQQRIEISEYASDPRNKANDAYVVVVSLCDDNGQIFTVEDLPDVVQFSGDVIERVARAAAEFNGLGSALPKKNEVPSEASALPKPAIEVSH